MLVDFHREKKKKNATRARLTLSLARSSLVISFLQEKVPTSTMRMVRTRATIEVHHFSAEVVPNLGA